MLSRCCKFDTFSTGEYYNCLKCHRPCGIIFLSEDEKRCLNDDRNEHRSKNQVEEPFNQS